MQLLESATAEQNLRYLTKVRKLDAAQALQLVQGHKPAIEPPKEREGGPIDLLSQKRAIRIMGLVESHGDRLLRLYHHHTAKELQGKLNLKPRVLRTMASVMGLESHRDAAHQRRLFRGACAQHWAKQGKTHTWVADRYGVGVGSFWADLKWYLEHREGESNAA